MPLFTQARTQGATFLLPIGEDDTFEVVEEPTNESAHPLDSDVIEAKLEKAKASTAVLADEAESSMLELQRLLGKTKTGTATRSDKDRHYYS